jgi:hypothetical protein
MNSWVKALVVLMFSAAPALAADNSVVEAVQASADVPLQTGPTQPFGTLRAQPI